MSILGTLKNLIWSEESQKVREMAYSRYAARMRELAALQKAQNDQIESLKMEIERERTQTLAGLTPIQEIIKDIPGQIDPSSYDPLQNVAQSASYYQRMIAAQNSLNQSLHSTQNIWTGTSMTTGTSIYQSGAIIPQSAAAGIYTSTTTGVGTLNMYSFYEDKKNFLFYAMRGVEEVADSRWHHEYDRFAVELLDSRTFKDDTVSILGVVSFCTSNLADPDWMINLLKSRGVTVK